MPLLARTAFPVACSTRARGSDLTYMVRVDPLLACPGLASRCLQSRDAERLVCHISTRRCHRLSEAILAVLVIVLCMSDSSSDNFHRTTPAPLALFRRSSPTLPFTRCRAEVRSSDTCPLFSSLPSPVVLTVPRPIVPLRCAPHHPAKSPLASSNVATIAASAAASSAGSTRATMSVSMSSHVSILRAIGTVPATVATAPSASGSTFGPAAPTARAQTVAMGRVQPQKPSRLLLRRSALRPHALAA